MPGSLLTARFQVPIHEDTDKAARSELEAFLRRCCITFVQKCIRLVIDGRARYVKEETDDQPL